MLVCANNPEIDYLLVLAALSSGSIRITEHDSYHMLIERLQAGLEAARRLGYSIAEPRLLAALTGGFVVIGKADSAIETGLHGLDSARAQSDVLAESEILCYLSEASADLGDMAHAISYAEKALELARAHGFHRLESQALSHMSTAHTRLGNLDESLQCMQQAIELAQAQGDKHFELRGLANISIIYTDLGKFSLAAGAINRALELADEVGDRSLDGDLYLKAARIARLQGRLTEAESATQRSLARAKELGAQRLEANIMGELGALYSTRGELRTATQAYEQQRQLAMVHSAVHIEVIALSGLAKLAHLQGDLRRACAWRFAELAAARAINDEGNVSVCYANLGNTLAILGATNRARQCYECALEIAQEKHLDRIKALPLNGLSSLAINAGALQQAINLAQEVLTIAKSLDIPSEEIRAYQLLGNASVASGDAEQAIAYYEHALKLCEVYGDQESEIRVLQDFGEVCAVTKEFQRASNYQQRALNLARLKGYRLDECWALSNLANISLRSGTPERARAFLVEQEKLLRHLESQPLESAMKKSLGYMYEQLGDRRSALRCFNEQLMLARAASNTIDILDALLSIGVNWGNLGQMGRAASYFRQAYRIAATTGYQVGQIEAAKYLAYVFERLGKLPEALALLETVDTAYQRANHPEASVVEKQVGELRQRTEHRKAFWRCWYVLNWLKRWISVLANRQKAL